MHLMLHTSQSALHRRHLNSKREKKVQELNRLTPHCVYGLAEICLLIINCS